MRSRSFRGRTARLTFALVFVGLALTAGGVVAAQEERPEVRLVVEGGIDGWVDPKWPMTLTARIESDILLVGELLVVQGRELARMEVEVPADGARSYEVVTAPPTNQGAILLQVIPDGAAGDEPVASAFFRPRLPANEILVGLVGLSRLEQVLGEVRSAVSGTPITPVEVDNPEIRLAEGEFHQLGYLVMDRPGPLPSATVSWLQGGGRLVTTSAALETMGLDAAWWGNFPGVETETGWYGVDDGEVLALDSLAGLDSQLWAALLRPLPVSAGRQDGFFEGPASSLTRAALAVETRTPGYPWLPLVVVAYAVVIGPVNLWILRRRRRLEWAWFTIPVLGLVGVAAFWVVGNSGVNETFWSHGTVQVAGPDSQTRSGLVAATSRARTLELSFNPDWHVFPENLDQLSGDFSQPTISGAGDYEYDLSSLGWLSLNAFRRGEPLEIEVTFSERGVEMTNASSTPVVAWGVHAYPKIAIGGELEPGVTGFLSWEQVLDAGPWWAFRDAFWELNAMREEGNVNQNWPTVIGDLGDMAQASGMVDVPFYVFAIMDEPIADVEVDGRRQTVPGVKMVFHPVPADRMGGAGWAFARSVWWDAAARDIGFDGEPVFAEQWILSYRLPAGLSTPARLVLGGLDPDFLGFRGVPEPAEGEEGFEDGEGWEVWDWDTSGFVPFDVDRELDPARFVAPSGETLIRVSGARLEMTGPLAGVMMWGDLR